jgi:nucleoside-diphosphate-sugar epimerase
MVDAAVIGGNGFIGRYLVNHLRAAGKRVRIISRNVVSSSVEGLEYARAEVADPGALGEALRGVREVYHLATGGGPSWRDFERDFVEGTRNVCNACEANQVRRLVFTSSIAALYLGDAGTITETAGLDPKPELRSFYSRAKAAAEKLLMELHAATKFPVVIVRPGVVMGRGGMLNHSGLGLWMSDLCCIGWGYGNHPLPFVLADDVATGLIAAMETPGVEGRAFNLAGDVRLSAAEFVRILADCSRRRIQFYPRSLAWLQAVEILKWGIKIAARKPENPFPSYRDLKSRSLRTQLDCSAAKQVLGWRPTKDVDAFLQEAVYSCIRPIQPGDLRLAPAALSNR